MPSRKVTKRSVNGDYKPRTHISNFRDSMLSSLPRQLLPRLPSMDWSGLALFTPSSVVRHGLLLTLLPTHAVPGAQHLEHSALL
eukprot:COSAG03_NODE_13318_length_507_cov_1.156863_1_plen_84_part_00